MLSPRLTSYVVGAHTVTTSRSWGRGDAVDEGSVDEPEDGSTLVTTGMNGGWEGPRSPAQGGVARLRVRTSAPRSLVR